MMRHSALLIGVLCTLLVADCASNDRDTPAAASPSADTTLAAPPPGSDVSLWLHTAIGQFMQAEQVPSDDTHTFFADFVDLNGDDTLDAIVILRGSSWCGTGGCTMLVFRGDDRGFTLVSRSSLVRPPVTASDTTTNGWRDLVLRVSGGGMPPKTVALRFDGRQYPLNPSDQTALPDEAATRGTVLFPEGAEPVTLPGGAPPGDLQVYDEEPMPIATRYPDTMTVEANCSGEGCGYFFAFERQDGPLDRATVHLFLPAGAATAADAEIDLESLMQSNGWTTIAPTGAAPEFTYPWVRKVVSFSAEPGMIGYVLLGETSGQGIRATLLCPAESSEAFIPAARTILDNLRFKPDKLPLTTRG